MNYIENIKRIRNDKRVSQTDMAEKLGIAQNNYGRIERGLTELTVDRIYKIAEILEVSVLDILGEISKPLDSPDIESLRRENEKLKESVDNANHRVRDFEIRASMYDKIEAYYLEGLQDDLDEIYRNRHNKEYTDWLDSIENQEDKLNSHYFIVFSENNSWYEMAMDELSILRDSKLILAWKRYNYINTGGIGIDVYKDLLGSNYYESMNSEEAQYKVLDMRIRSGKYQYSDFEINIIKEKIKR